MTTQPIHAFAKWQVKEEHLQEVLSILPQMIIDTRNEEGNLYYKIHQSISEPQTLVLHEGYKDEAALEAHRASDHFKAMVLNQIVPLLEKREIVITNQILQD